MILCSPYSVSFIHSFIHSFILSFFLSAAMAEFRVHHLVSTLLERLGYVAHRQYHRSSHFFSPPFILCFLFFAFLFMLPRAGADGAEEYVDSLARNIAPYNPTQVAAVTARSTLARHSRRTKEFQALYDKLKTTQYEKTKTKKIKKK